MVAVRRPATRNLRRQDLTQLCAMQIRLKARSTDKRPGNFREMRAAQNIIREKIGIEFTVGAPP